MRTAAGLKKLIERSLDEGNGSFLAVPATGMAKTYSAALYCTACKQSFEPLDPRLFSFNSRRGACPHCEGLGLVDERTCPACNGLRLKDDALAVKVDGYGIGALVAQPVKEAKKLVQKLAFHAHQQAVGEPIRKEIVSRLQFLERVGLSYLSLHRSSNTLVRRRIAASPSCFSVRI